MKVVTASDIEIKIDKEFQDLLHAHSKEEAEELRKSVLAEGFTDSLKVWYPSGETKTPTLIDGHHCYKLWCSLPDDAKISPPTVREINLESREAVRVWILRRQLGRRNLNPQTASLIRGRLYNEYKAALECTSSGQSVPSGDITDTECDRDASALAKEKVARETGTSTKNVGRDGEHATAMARIKAFNPKAEADIENGTLKLSNADRTTISKLGDGDLGKALKNLRNGKAWNWQPSDSTPAREPGDDTDKEANGKAGKQTKTTRQPKAGKISFDDRIIPDLLGKLARALNDRSKTCGGETPTYKDCRDCWERLNAAWKRWQLFKEKR